MEKITSQGVGELMDNVDKCKTIIELLEVKYADSDWGLAQALSLMKDILNPTITSLVEVIEVLDKHERNANNIMKEAA